MTDWQDVKNIEDLKTLCNQLGFRFGPCIYSTPTDIALYPTEKLGIYNTEIAMYRGNIEDLIVFLRGWKQNLEYLKQLDAVNDKVIERKIQKYRDKLVSDRVLENLTSDC